MKKIYIKTLDRYIANAFVFDAIVCIVFCFVLHLLRDHINFPLEKKDLDNLYSSISSSAVSFAGFILASLTIIVTVKANLQAKDMESAVNGMQLLLSSRNYKKIINVFRVAIIELVCILIVLYVAWVPVFKISLFKLTSVAVVGILIISLAVLRTLMVLFSIIYLEFRTYEE